MGRSRRRPTRHRPPRRQRRHVAPSSPTPPASARRGPASSRPSWGQDRAGAWGVLRAGAGTGVPETPCPWVCPGLLRLVVSRSLSECLPLQLLESAEFSSRPSLWGEDREKIIPFKGRGDKSSEYVRRTGQLQSSSPARAPGCFIDGSLVSSPALLKLSGVSVYLSSSYLC